LINDVAALVLAAEKPSYCVSFDKVRGWDRAVGPVKSGFVANTRDPVPVSSLHAVRMFALENVPNMVATFEPRPLTPVVIGRPVQLVKVPLAGVPSIGVVEFVIILPVVPL